MSGPSPTTAPTFYIPPWLADEVRAADPDTPEVRWAQRGLEDGTIGEYAPWPPERRIWSWGCGS